MRFLARVATGAFRLTRNVVVGRSPSASGPTPISQSHPLARYNKVLAVPVAAFLTWLGGKLGVDLAEYELQVTLAIIGYLVWRFPNALPAGR
jgi:uncharacterized membrane protein (DUF441 family)